MSQSVPGDLTIPDLWVPLNITSPADVPNRGRVEGPEASLVPDLIRGASGDSSGNARTGQQLSASLIADLLLRTLIGWVPDAIILGWAAECLLAASGCNDSVELSTRAAFESTSPTALPSDGCPN